MRVISFALVLSPRTWCVYHWKVQLRGFPSAKSAVLRIFVTAPA